MNLTEKDLTVEIYTTLRAEGKSKTDIAQTYGFKNMYSLNKVLKALGVEVVPGMVEKPEFAELGSVPFQEHHAAKKQIEELQEKNAQYIERNQELYAEIRDYEKFKSEIADVLYSDSNACMDDLETSEIVTAVREMDAECESMNAENIKIKAAYSALIEQSAKTICSNACDNEDPSCEGDSLPVFLGLNNGNKLEMFLPESIAKNIIEEIQRPRLSRSICAKYVDGDFVAIDLREVVVMRASGLVDAEYIKPQPLQSQTSSINDKGRFRVECYCGSEYFADMYNGFREGRNKARCNGCGEEVLLDPHADKLIDPKDGVEAPLLTNRYPVTSKPRKVQQIVQEQAMASVHNIPSKSRELKEVPDLRSIKNIGREYKDPCQLLG